MHKCSSTILYAACTFRTYKSTTVLKLFRTFTGKMTRGLSLQMVFSLFFVETLLMVRPFFHVPSFRGHCCPGVSRPVPADGGSSSPRSGSILPSLFSKINTYIWRWFGSLRAGATVLYGINWRNRHLCRLAASLLHKPFEYGEFLIAHFTLVNCVDKITDFLSRHRNCIL